MSYDFIIPYPNKLWAKSYHFISDLEIFEFYSNPFCYHMIQPFNIEIFNNLNWDISIEITEPLITKDKPILYMRVVYKDDVYDNDPHQYPFPDYHGDTEIRADGTCKLTPDFYSTGELQRDINRLQTKMEKELTDIASIISQKTKHFPYTKDYFPY